MTTIASISAQDLGPNGLAITITLSNGLSETFIVTTDNGVQTWTKDDGSGTVVATVDVGTELSNVTLVQILIQQITGDARGILEDLGVPGDLGDLSSDQIAEAGRNLAIDLGLGLPPGTAPPSAEELQEEAELELLDGLTEGDILPGRAPIMTITNVPGEDGVTLVTVTLTNGLSETFSTSINGGLETWSTLEGTVVATFNQLTGTLDQARELVQTLADQVALDKQGQLTQPDGPGKGDLRPGPDAKEAAALAEAAAALAAAAASQLPAGANANTVAAALAIEMIYFTAYEQGILAGMTPDEAEAYAEAAVAAYSGSAEPDPQP